MDWGFLLQDETIGVVTWVGTILTIAGLVYTIVVAKGARAAADEAVRLIQGQHSLANIAFSYAQITLVKTLINSKNMTGAGIVFLSLKREIYGILSFLKDRHDLPGEIAIVKRNLVTIERQLDPGLSHLSFPELCEQGCEEVVVPAGFFKLALD